MRWSKNFQYYLLTLLPIGSFFIVWSILNKQYPLSDYAQYFEGAQHLLDGLKNASGPFEFISQLYFLRTFKPVILHIFPVLPLAIFKGNVLVSVAVVNFLFLMVMCLYLFLFIRIRFGHRVSFFMTSFILFYPWVFLMSTYFGTELPLLVFSLGYLYHIEQSSYFSSRKHTILAALYVVGAICIRPILGVAILFPGLFLFVLSSFFSRKVNRFDVVFFTVNTLIPLIAFIPISTSYYSGGTVAKGCIYLVTFTYIIMIAIACWRRWQRKTGQYLLLFSLFMYIPFYWYIGSLENFHDWIYAGVIGPSSFKGPRVGVPFYTFFIDTIVRLGGAPLLMLLLYLTIFKYLKTKCSTGLLSWSPIHWLLGGSFFVPCFAGSFTNSGDYRYYFVPIVFLSLFIFLRLCDWAKAKYVVFWGIIFNVVIGGANLVGGLNAFKNSAVRDLSIMVNGFFVLDEITNQGAFDQRETFGKEILKDIGSLERCRRGPCRIGVFLFELNTDLEYFLDGFVVKILNKEFEYFRGVVEIPYNFFDFNINKMRLEIIEKNIPPYDYYLMELPNKKITNENAYNVNWISLANEFRENYKSTSLNRMGLELIKRIDPTYEIAERRSVIIVKPIQK